jgi:hypothetical protein
MAWKSAAWGTASLNLKNTLETSGEDVDNLNSNLSYYTNLQRAEGNPTMVRGLFLHFYLFLFFLIFFLFLIQPCAEYETEKRKINENNKIKISTSEHCAPPPNPLPTARFF